MAGEALKLCYQQTNHAQFTFTFTAQWLAINSDALIVETNDTGQDTNPARLPGIMGKRLKSVKAIPKVNPIAGGTVGLAPTCAVDVDTVVVTIGNAVTSDPAAGEKVIGNWIEVNDVTSPDMNGQDVIYWLSFRMWIDRAQFNIVAGNTCNFQVDVAWEIEYWP